MAVCVCGDKFGGKLHCRLVYSLHFSKIFQIYESIVSISPQPTKQVEEVLYAVSDWKYDTLLNLAIVCSVAAGYEFQQNNNM